MSYDPRFEDYQRLGLRFARTVGELDAFGTARAFAGFGRRYAQNRDALPQSDEDRAFHLVAEATVLVDYDLPFAPNEQVDKLIKSATEMLEEAIELDDQCHDARRMLAAARVQGFEGYYRFLADGSDRVRRDCERRRREATADLPSGDQSELAGNLAMRPYLRWVSTQATRALVCGRYRMAAQLSEQLLELDPFDESDARFTCAYAYAKLEDLPSLEKLAKHTRKIRPRSLHEDAWTTIARIALAHKQRDYEHARTLLASLVDAYPRAALTLSRQDELADGVFSRLACQPFSEDELILAVSEGAVLLQEGRYAEEHGPLGSWIAAQECVVSGAREDARRSAR